MAGDELQILRGWLVAGMVVHRLVRRVHGLYASDVGGLSPVAERVAEAQRVLVRTKRMRSQVALQLGDIFLPASSYRHRATPRLYR
jgi:hypothetical protein